MPVNTIYGFQVGSTVYNYDAEHLKTTANPANASNSYGSPTLVANSTGDISFKRIIPAYDANNDEGKVLTVVGNTGLVWAAPSSGGGGGTELPTLPTASRYVLMTNGNDGDMSAVWGRIIPTTDHVQDGYLHCEGGSLSWDYLDLNSGNADLPSYNYSDYGKFLQVDDMGQLQWTEIPEIPEIPEYGVSDGYNVLRVNSTGDQLQWAPMSTLPDLPNGSNGMLYLSFNSSLTGQNRVPRWTTAPLPSHTGMEDTYLHVDDRGYLVWDSISVEGLPDDPGYASILYYDPSAGPSWVPISRCYVVHGNDAEPDVGDHLYLVVDYT